MSCPRSVDAWMFRDCTMHLEHAEDLSAGTRLGHRLVGNNVEANGLGERSEIGRKQNGKRSERQLRQGNGSRNQRWKRKSRDEAYNVPALANSDDVTLLNANEGGRKVSREILVALLETVVLSNVVEVISADNDSALHLVGDNDTTEDATADVNVTGEGALLIDVGALDSGLRGLVAKTDVTPVANTASLGGLREEKRKKVRGSDSVQSA